MTLCFSTKRSRRKKKRNLHNYPTDQPETQFKRSAEQLNFVPKNHISLIVITFSCCVIILLIQILEFNLIVYAIWFPQKKHQDKTQLSQLKETLND